jgi:hypothetical protein
MRINIVALLLICFQACKAQPGQRKITYSWLGTEGYPKNAKGEMINGIQLLPPHELKSPGNEFIFYENDDSILMKIPGLQGDMYKKTAISAKQWKPAAQYGNTFFFLNTYTNIELPGLYASFYVTKDRKSLMQLHYTNPGNLLSVMIFSTDSTGASTKGLVDPRHEIPEPEEPVISIQSNK